MKNNYAVFIGDVAIDEYYSVNNWPGTADKADCEYIESKLGGTIANAACVYSSYGKETLFSSVLCPNDRFLCDNLQSLGINTDLVVFDEKLSSSKCLIFLCEGEHTIFIIDTKLDTINITKDIQDVFCGASVIYSNFLSLERLRLDDKMPEAILKEWYENGVKIFVDSDVDNISEASKPLIPYVHTIFFNEVGFNKQMSSSTNGNGINEILSSGPDYLIQTLAEKGCIVYSKNCQLSIDGVPADVVDVTGAGDTFCSSFAFFFGLSGDAELSARFATFASSRSVTILGARGGAYGIEKVLEYMKKKGENVNPYLKYLQNLI